MWAVTMSLTAAPPKLSCSCYSSRYRRAASLRLASGSDSSPTMDTLLAGTVLCVCSLVVYLVPHSRIGHLNPPTTSRRIGQAQALPSISDPSLAQPGHSCRRFWKSLIAANPFPLTT